MNGKQRQQAMGLFQFIDRNNSKEIELQELCRVFQDARLERDPDTDEPTIFEQIDVTGDGHIRVDEWLKWLRTLGPELQPTLDELAASIEEVKQQEQEQQLAMEEEHQGGVSQRWQEKLTAMKEDVTLWDDKLDAGDFDSSPLRAEALDNSPQAARSPPTHRSPMSPKGQRSMMLGRPMLW